MKTVKVIRPYTDTNTKEEIETGAVFAVSNERFEVLAGKNKYNNVYVEEIDMTVADIKAELDKREIDYPSNAKKADLLKLLEG